MTDRRLLSLTVGCFVLSCVPFWLWKLYLITQRRWVFVLICLFVFLFGLSLVFSFILGSRWIIRITPRRGKRGLLFIALLFGEAYAALMAALGMNFVGQ